MMYSAKQITYLSEDSKNLLFLPTDLTTSARGAFPSASNPRVSCANLDVEERGATNSGEETVPFEHT